MRHNIFFLLICVIFNSSVTAYASTATENFNEIRRMIPSPDMLKLRDGSVRLGANTSFSVAAAWKSQLSYISNEFTKALSLLPVSESFAVYVDKVQTTSFPEYKRGSYRIGVDKVNKILSVKAADVQGAIHGMVWLQFFADQGGVLPIFDLLSMPEHNIRALHLVIGGGNAVNVTPKRIKKAISLARQNHFNTLILQLGMRVRFNSISVLPDHLTWSIQEFVDVVDFARKNGLNVIPEFKFLSHQKKFLKKKYPHLMFNKETYDPQNSAVYDIVFPLLDEVIELIHPQSIHIGHDEVLGWKNKSEQNDGLNIRMLPAHLFKEDVLKLHAFLKSRGVETWMWGDMLLSPKQFPKMRAKGLHGGVGGYSDLVAELPNDIVICDWHYVDKQKQFPSSKMFIDKGYKVLGATWKRKKTIYNFSRYIAKLSDDNAPGMIATVWWHIKRDQWEIVTDIISTSAEAFWNDK